MRPAGREPTGFKQKCLMVNLAPCDKHIELKTVKVCRVVCELSPMRLVTYNVSNGYGPHENLLTKKTKQLSS